MESHWALRRSSRELDYIVGILSSMCRYFWGHKNSILTWNPQRPHGGHHDLLVWNTLGIDDVTNWLSLPWWAWSKETELILKPGPFIAFRQRRQGCSSIASRAFIRSEELLASSYVMKSLVSLALVQTWSFKLGPVPDAILSCRQKLYPPSYLWVSCHCVLCSMVILALRESMAPLHSHPLPAAELGPSLVAELSP